MGTGRLQCHHKPWWSNLELTLYIPNYTQGKRKPPLCLPLSDYLPILLSYCMTIWYCLAQSHAIWRYLALLGAIWDYLVLYGAIWVYPTQLNYIAVWTLSDL